MPESMQFVVSAQIHQVESPQKGAHLTDRLPLAQRLELVHLAKPPSQHYRPRPQPRPFAHGKLCEYGNTNVQWLNFNYRAAIEFAPVSITPHSPASKLLWQYLHLKTARFSSFPRWSMEQRLNASLPLAIHGPSPLLTSLTVAHPKRSMHRDG